MGIFFNPGNGSFTKDRNYEIYVDKTELLKYLNRAIGTPGNCIAVSHARRFGKSHAAGMIDAYYSLGSDSAKLFKGTKIASDPDYEKYRNKYNVIHLDISSFWDFHKKDIVEKIIEDIFKELKMDYPEEFNERLCFKTGVLFCIFTETEPCDRAHEKKRNKDDHGQHERRDGADQYRKYLLYRKPGAYADPAHNSWRL